jgi:hypothetical protein
MVRTSNVLTLQSTTHTHGAMNIDLSLYRESGNVFERMSRADIDAAGHGYGEVLIERP